MSQSIKYAAFFALAALPLVEIGLLIRLGQTLGFWKLAFIVVATAFVGVLVIRRVGISIFGRVLATLERAGTQDSPNEKNRLEPLLDGFLQVLAGLLLILPGPISDGLGLLLLLPIVRRAFAASGFLKLVSMFHYQAEVSRESFRQPADAEAHAHDGITIEGEYERVSEKIVKPDTRIEPRRARN